MANADKSHTHIVRVTHIIQNCTTKHNVATYRLRDRHRHAQTHTYRFWFSLSCNCFN